MSYEMNAPVVATVDQLFPRVPIAAPGCDVCGALLRQWRGRKDPRSPEYDPSGAADAAVEIRRHPGHGPSSA
ncbi:hypothetical protein ABZY31_06815 [Streptomyces sp. NPDC006529]|uniref:hypothetical protein n=1 Tax=Streptomyces sp. NPDC006529 TaxID=3157177 RepID=UPI0033B0C320